MGRGLLASVAAAGISGSHGAAVTPESVPVCPETFPPQCSMMGGINYWGACHTKSGNWRCIVDIDLDARFLEGDCLTEKLPGSAETYDGLCRFEREDPILYKCESVPTFNRADAAECRGMGRASLPEAACFSLTPETPWQCWMTTLDNPSCVSTVDPTGRAVYDGGCVFDDSPDYHLAVDFEESGSKSESEESTSKSDSEERTSERNSEERSSEQAPEESTSETEEESTEPEYNPEEREESTEPEAYYYYYYYSREGESSGERPLEEEGEEEFISFV